jgi:hypothetical protein
VVYYHRPVAYGGLEHRGGLEPLYRNKANPLKVRVAAADARTRETPRKLAVASN